MLKLLLLFPEKVIRLLNGVFVSLYAARLFDLKEYSVVAQGFIILSIFVNVLSSSQLKGVWIKRYSKEQSLAQLNSLVYGFSMVTGIFAFIYVFLVAGTLEEWIYYLPFVVLAFFQFLVVSRWKIEADSDWSYLAWADSSILTFSLILKIIVLFNWRSLLGYGCILFFENFVILFHPMIRDRVRFKNVNMELFKTGFEKYFRYLIVVILSLLYSKIDQLLLTWLSDDIEFSIYSLSVRINDLVYILPVVLLSYFSPIIYRAENKNNERKIKRKLLISLMTTSLVFILITYLCPIEVFEGLVTSKYANSLGILRILSWSTLSVFLGYYWSIEVILNNFQSQYIISYLIGMLINIVGSLLIYPYLGLEGIAWVTVIGFTLSSLYGVIRYSSVEIMYTLLWKRE